MFEILIGTVNCKYKGNLLEEKKIWLQWCLILRNLAYKNFGDMALFGGSGAAVRSLKDIE